MAVVTVPAMIEVADLHVRFGATHAVQGVSFRVPRGTTFGLVGESGSGKSTVLRALAGLVPRGERDGWWGEMLLDGRPLGEARDRVFHRSVQMVFQDPYGSLHPRQTVDRILAEPLIVHGIGGAEARIPRALDEVALPRAARFRFPHQHAVAPPAAVGQPPEDARRQQQDDRQQVPHEGRRRQRPGAGDDEDDGDDALHEQADLEGGREEQLPAGGPCRPDRADEGPRRQHERGRAERDGQGGEHGQQRRRAAPLP